MWSSKTDQMSINVKVLFHVLARDFKPVAAELTSSSTQGGENKNFHPYYTSNARHGRRIYTMLSV
jgi:hypothetical protein